MTAIAWTTLDSDVIERIVAVGLCRRHTHARRVKPSQGDGGLDVLVPSVGPAGIHVDNYQVKKFADVLNDSRQRQIVSSLKRAIATHNGDEFAYKINTWYLTLPMDLTREQERWLAQVADENNAPFEVSVFGLTAIEELLLEAPEIREYYIGDGMQRVQQALDRITTLTGMSDLIEGDGSVKPAKVTETLAELYSTINADDPHFGYEYQVTADFPRIDPGPGLIASVSGRSGPDQPYVTWHIAAKYDTALEDREIPGGYTVYPDRMSEEQKAAWERWRDYGTPVTLEGDVVEDFDLQLPGGLGVEGSLENKSLRISPAIGEFDDEPTTRSLWSIEDPEGNMLAECRFDFRLTSRGMAGGEHRQGTDQDGFLAVDLYMLPTSETTGNMQVSLTVFAERWAGQPVQRVLPVIRFLSVWGDGNRLRFSDEFGLAVADQTLQLHGTPQISSVLAEAVADLVRISTATKQAMLLPETMPAIADRRGQQLHLIADTVEGLEPQVRIDEMVLFVKDDEVAIAELMGRDSEEPLSVPWPVPFSLFGATFRFAFVMEVEGDFDLAYEEPSETQPPGTRAVRVTPSATTRARLLWLGNDAEAMVAVEGGGEGEIEAEGVPEGGGTGVGEGSGGQ